ncbi:hypothetical protein [Vibrio owensii]|uniref:hypothetical protein n=1 Tax=Vibrio owensii TaxID=696485 RepID=UPI003CC687D7
MSKKTFGLLSILISIIIFGVTSQGRYTSEPKENYHTDKDRDINLPSWHESEKEILKSRINPKLKYSNIEGGDIGNFKVWKSESVKKIASFDIRPMKGGFLTTSIVDLSEKYFMAFNSTDSKKGSSLRYRRVYVIDYDTDDVVLKALIPVGEDYAANFISVKGNVIYLVENAEIISSSEKLQIVKDSSKVIGYDYGEDKKYRDQFYFAIGNRRINHMFSRDNVLKAFGEIGPESYSYYLKSKSANYSNFSLFGLGQKKTLNYSSFPMSGISTKENNSFGVIRYDVVNDKLKVRLKKYPIDYLQLEENDVLYFNKGDVILRRIREYSQTGSTAILFNREMVFESRNIFYGIFGFLNLEEKCKIYFTFDSLKYKEMNLFKLDTCNK